MRRGGVQIAQQGEQEEGATKRQRIEDPPKTLQPLEKQVPKEKEIPMSNTSSSRQ